MYASSGGRTRHLPASSLVVLGLTLLRPPAGKAQSGTWGLVGAQAVAVWEWADPVPGGGSLDEIRLVQPAIHLHAGAFGHLRLMAMLNLEGLTIPDGELAPGDWGEGFVDRRHPHTYAHELILAGDDLLGRLDGDARVSVSIGKGFAPFGTDDPMVRPFVRYPVNHHLSQILECAVAIAAVRAGRVAGEVGLFDGDEPERPGQWPRLGGRFGDSWSARLTTFPLDGLELQGSHAHVHSPEHRPGAGTDQSKWSLSARWSGPILGRPLYAMMEWARTSEADGFFVFHTLLAEGAWTLGRHRLQYRIERTERPEEERTSAFRALRPHLENSVLGISRWTVQTVGYEIDALHIRQVDLRPLVEISYGSIAKVGGGFFDIAQLYGDDAFWSLTVGMRLGLGHPLPRMGRYGALEDVGGMSGHAHGGHVE
jgi:hypothetical protein